MIEIHQLEQEFFEGAPHKHSKDRKIEGQNLQVSCRHAAGKAEIQPMVWNQTTAVEKFQENYTSLQYFFFGYELDSKTKTVLKRQWNEL